MQKEIHFDFKMEKEGRTVFLPEHNIFGTEYDVTITCDNPDEFFSVWDIEALEKMLHTQLIHENFKSAELIKKHILIKQKYMSKNKLIEEIKEAQEVTKDFNLFKHLFSDDTAVKTMAKLNQSLESILFHLKLAELKEIAPPKNNVIEDPLSGKKGSLVKVRPCAEKYNNKTYLGFLIGEVAQGSSITISDDKIQVNWSHHNPAIFVPELGEIIYGCASWWGVIKDENDLKDISDADIENVWYVQLLKKMNQEKPSPNNGN